MCLPELDNYGSPYKTSIWAPPAVASSKPTRNERGKLPPGLSGGPQAASDRVTNNKTTGANAAASRPSVQQAPKPQLAPSSRPSPLEDPSVVTALPMSVAQMPQQRQSAHPSASLKVSLKKARKQLISGHGLGTRRREIFNRVMGRSLCRVVDFDFLVQNTP